MYTFGCCFTIFIPYLLIGICMDHWKCVHVDLHQFDDHGRTQLCSRAPPLLNADIGPHLHYNLPCLWSVSHLRLNWSGSHSSGLGVYRIVENFRELVKNMIFAKRKLSQIARFCSTKGTTPPILWRKLSWIATKPQIHESFLPRKFPAIRFPIPFGLIPFGLTLFAINTWSHLQ